MDPFSTLQCSAFEKFHELYIEFRPTSNEELPALVRTATGYINPDFALPVNVVAEKLPQLKVRTYFLGTAVDKLRGNFCSTCNSQFKICSCTSCRHNFHLI